MTKKTSKKRTKKAVTLDEATAMSGAAKIEAGTMLFSLRVEQFGQTRHIRRSEYTVAEEGFKAKTSAVALRLDSPAIKAIVRHDDQTRNAVKAMTLPSYLREGVRRVPLANVARLVDFIKTRAEEREALIEAFRNDYEAAKERTKAAKGALFHESDYPSATAAAEEYALRWQFLASGVPEHLQLIAPETFEAERSKYVAQMEEAAHSYVVLLREQFAGLVNRVVERLTPAADGKPKVFRNTLVGNVSDCIKEFGALNVADDAALAGLVDKLDALVKGVDLNLVRDDEALRASVREQFAEVAMTLEGLVAEAKTGQRRVRLAEEED